MSSVDGAIRGLLAVKQSAVLSEISVAVAAKQLDAQRMEGDAAVALIEAAAKLAREVGKGLHVDALA